MQKDTISVAVFGIGRMGTIHAKNLVNRDGIKLKYIVDQDQARAEEAARLFSCTKGTSEQVFNDPSINAVIIASSSDSHATLIEQAAKAQKAVFCEKPIHLNLQRTTECVKIVNDAKISCVLGFNRRFDPSFRAMKSKIDEGAIGKLEQLIITSRDPQPPHMEYVRDSGGILKDMTIHDFDMSRWMLDEEPRWVFATASRLIDPRIEEFNDFDSVMVIMKTSSGKQIHINNSRRTSYGYDQRIEAHGSKGMVRAENETSTRVQMLCETGVITDKPKHFMLERYPVAYRCEIDEFVGMLQGKKFPLPSAEDGLQSLKLAEAAKESLSTGQLVEV